MKRININNKKFKDQIFSWLFNILKEVIKCYFKKPKLNFLKKKKLKQCCQNSTKKNIVLNNRIFFKNL